MRARDADAVADHVMRHLDGWPGGLVDCAADQPVRRAVRTEAVGAEGGELSDDEHADIRRAEGGGQPLADDTRSAMEGAFGADFGRIRVHTDSTADRLSRQLSATTFTTGADVFFRSGAYQPAKRAGERLLAHELAHTVQQGAATTMPSRIQRSAAARTQQGAATTMPSRIQRSAAARTQQGAATTMPFADPALGGRPDPAGRGGENALANPALGGRPDPAGRARQRRNALANPARSTPVRSLRGRLEANAESESGRKRVIRR